LNNLAIEVENANVGILLREPINSQYQGTSLRTFSCSSGIGVKFGLRPVSNHFDELDRFLESNPDWVFGYLGYDLKNQIENLESNNPDGIGFQDMFFFTPKILMLINNDTVEIQYIRNEVSQLEVDGLVNRLDGEYRSAGQRESSVIFQSKYSYSEYLQTVNEVKTAYCTG
jgi:para-aminobenzoate synthetase component 1